MARDEKLVPRDALSSSFCSPLPRQRIRDWLITDGAPLALLGATVMVIMSYGAARQRAPRFR